MYRNMPFVEVHAVDHCNQNCRWCHNYSPFSPKREYEPREYFPWLDILRDKNVRVDAISIMGGEPMLHSDITGFCARFVERYRRPLVLTTNGFWLDEEAVDVYSDLWKMVAYLKISHYPMVSKRLGGHGRMKEVVAGIRRHNPQLLVEFPEKFDFNRLAFFEHPVEVEFPCANSGCTALLADGRLGRCGAGAYMHFAPEEMLTEGFCNSKHMHYDLRNWEWASFWMWFNRFPLDACAYCSFALRNRSMPWKVEKGRRPFNAEYESDFAVKTAAMHLRQGQTAEAGRALDRIDPSQRERKEVVNFRGMLHYHSGQVDEALGCFRQALELDPDFSDAAANIRHVAAQARQAAHLS